MKLFGIRHGWSALINDGETSGIQEIEIHWWIAGVGALHLLRMIYGIMTGKNLSETTDFAVAASALKQTISGDFNLVNVDEVTQLMNGDTSGRVQR